MEREYWECSLLEDSDILSYKPLRLPRCSVPLLALPSFYSGLECQCPSHGAVVITVGLKAVLHPGAC